MAMMMLLPNYHTHFDAMSITEEVVVIFFNFYCSQWRLRATFVTVLISVDNSVQVCVL